MLRYISHALCTFYRARVGQEEVWKRRKKGKTVTVQMMRMKKMRGAWKKTDKVMKRMLNDKLLKTCHVKKIPWKRCFSQITQVCGWQMVDV